MCLEKKEKFKVGVLVAGRWSNTHNLAAVTQLSPNKSLNTTRDVRDLNDTRF